MEITQDFIPMSVVRKGTPLAASKFITIHETGNPSPGADALMHNKYIRSAANLARGTSWHFTVDDHSIYQHLPTSEQGIHAGTRAGNTQSIGIEICINPDGNFEQAKKNAQWLVAQLLVQLNLDKSKIKQHFDWSGKNCPATIRRTGTWQAFLNGIETGGEKAMLFNGCPNGEAVKEWQESLLKIIPGSLPNFGADSDFGGETEEWTNFFKNKVGLPHDGKVDDITYGRMLNKLQELVAAPVVTVDRVEIDRLNAANNELVNQIKIYNENYNTQANEKSKLIKESITQLQQINVLTTQNEGLIRQLAVLDAQIVQLKAIVPPPETVSWFKRMFSSK